MGSRDVISQAGNPRNKNTGNARQLNGQTQIYDFDFFTDSLGAARSYADRKIMTFFVYG